MRLAVEAPAGERWDAALDLIRAGEGGANLPRCRIWRWSSGHEVDDRVRFEIGSRFSPSFASLQSVDEDLQRGLGMLQHAKNADPRLRELIDEFGLLIELITDVGERGTPLLMATVGEDGELDWVEGMRPRM